MAWPPPSATEQHRRVAERHPPQMHVDRLLAPSGSDKRLLSTASGRTALAFSSAGVALLSVSRLPHSAPILDIGLDTVP